MDITLEQYQDIQRYLDGAMDKEQAAAFQRALETNKEVNDAFMFEKEIRDHAGPIREAMEIASLNELPENSSTDTGFFQDSIKKAETEYKARHAKPRIITLRWAMSAAAVLILVIGGFILFQHHTESPAALFADYFKKDTLPADNYPMLAQAFTDYRNNKYTTLQKYDLEDLPTLKGGDEQRQKILELGYYYRGISWLATGDADKAGADLQWVIDHAQTPDLVWKAQWYEALSLIKLSNIPAATGLLRSISSNAKAEGYNTQAASLLDKLSKNQH
jgi:hypothetical protein